MSRKIRHNKRSVIQSLEQLILMSASGMEAEVLSVVDAQDVEVSSAPDSEQLALLDDGLSA